MTSTINLARHRPVPVFVSRFEFTVVPLRLLSPLLVISWTLLMLREVSVVAITMTSAPSSLDSDLPARWEALHEDPVDGVASSEFVPQEKLLRTSVQRMKAERGWLKRLSLLVTGEEDAETSSLDLNRLARETLKSRQSPSAPSQQQKRER